MVMHVAPGLQATPLANGHELVEAGFPLLPTLDHPHWTVTLAAPTPDQFGRVRALFRGPMTNPAWSGK